MALHLQLLLAPNLLSRIYSEISLFVIFFFFASRRRHTRSLCDWSSDVCSSDLPIFFGQIALLPAPSCQKRSALPSPSKSATSCTVQPPGAPRNCSVTLPVSA